MTELEKVGKGMVGRLEREARKWRLESASK
jgi:hypothetical protein